MKKISVTKRILNDWAIYYEPSMPRCAATLKVAASRTFGELAAESQEAFRHAMGVVTVFPDPIADDRLRACIPLIRQRYRGAEYFVDPRRALAVEQARQHRVHDIFFNRSLAHENDLHYKRNSLSITNINSISVIISILGPITETKRHYSLGDTNICVVHRPTANQPHNQWVQHIGSYGSEKKIDILSTIHDFLEVTELSPEDLIMRFFEHKQQGRAFFLHEFNLDSQHAALFNKMNRILFLTNIVEIARFFKLVDEGPQIESLFPVAFMMSRILRLASLGMLTLEDLFTADAPYNPAAGKRVADPKRAHIVERKIDDINSAYSARGRRAQRCVLFQPALIKELENDYQFSPAHINYQALQEEEDELYGEPSPCFR